MPRITIEVEGLDEEIARATEEISELGQLIAGDAGQELVRQSPVDTGFFVSNWRVGIGSENIGVSGSRPSFLRGLRRGGARSFGDPNLSQTATWNVAQGDVIFTNSVDYAEQLDAGGSNQAPQGITDPVAAIIDARYRTVG